MDADRTGTPQGGAARVRRHKYFAQQSLGAGAIHLLRACSIPLGWSDHRERNPKADGLIFVITQHYRFFISADYLLPDMELQQKEQLQTQDQHEHADHQKRYVHQKQKAHPAYLLPQGKTPHQYGHSIFAGF